MTATALAGAVLPDGPRSPRLVQAVQFAVDRGGAMRRLRRRYGSAFSVESLHLGRLVMLADPAEVRELFQTSPELADTPDANLGAVLGPGSFFSITGEEHRRQRKLLTPPFHGRRLRAYEQIIESETERETASWPEGKAFPVMPSTMRITLSWIRDVPALGQGGVRQFQRATMRRFVELIQRLTDTPHLRAAGVRPPSEQTAIILLGGLRELIATAVEDGHDVATIVGPAVEATQLLLGPRA